MLITIKSILNNFWLQCNHLHMSKDMFIKIEHLEDQFDILLKNY